MWIKICGTTNLEDALHAVAAGAHALGFVFAPSPRRVTVEQVRAISALLPRKIERYGVFVDASFDEIVTTVRRACLTGVQLHSHADPSLPRRLREHFNVKPRVHLGIHTTLHYTDDLDAQLTALGRDQAADALLRAADALLIDSRTASVIGGTGVTFDWKAAQRAFLRAAPRLRLIAAGGLRPENVADAIRTLSPWGVDVVTGVEASPGRKDPARVASFISNAKAAFALQEAAVPSHAAEP